MMKKYLIQNSEVYIGRKFEKVSLLLAEGKITVLPAQERPEGCEVIDASGKKAIPGLLDIHTHGAVGVDVNAADAEGLKKIARFFAGNGTTSWLASVLTDTEEQTERCIDQYLQFDQSGAEVSNLLGIHLEGPFLSKEYKGAMPEHLLKKPDAALARRWQERARGGIRYITVSPELEGAVDVIPELRACGMTVSIGHSGADYATAMKAIKAGAASSTHTGNAMRLLHQHEPAIWGAALETDIYNEMICDGLHLHPGVIRLYMKIKGNERLVAITDSIMAAGLPDGMYRLGVNDVVVREGDARLLNGVRAGSTLTADRGLRNVLAFTGLPLEEILPLFTENPAKLIGVFDRKGSIADGKDADIVLLDEKMQVDTVFLRGRLFEN